MLSRKISIPRPRRPCCRPQRNSTSNTRRLTTRPDASDPYRCARPTNDHCRRELVPSLAPPPNGHPAAMVHSKLAVANDPLRRATRTRTRWIVSRKKKFANVDAAQKTPRRRHPPANRLTRSPDVLPSAIPHPHHEEDPDGDAEKAEQSAYIKRSRWCKLNLHHLPLLM